MKIKKVFCNNCKEFVDIDLFYVKKNALYCFRCNTIVSNLTMEEED